MVVDCTRVGSVDNESGELLTFTAAGAALRDVVVGIAENGVDDAWAAEFAAPRTRLY